MKTIPDYNIEFAHIYSDETPGDEQQKGSEVLRSTLQRIARFNSVVSILIDDYHPAHFSLDMESFLLQFRDKKYELIS